MVQGTPEYKVDSIINHCYHYGKPNLVLCKGYSVKESSWEPLSNLTNCPEILIPYIQAHPELGSGGENFNSCLPFKTPGYVVTAPPSFKFLICVHTGLLFPPFPPGSFPNFI
ncbi:hypothetical protein DSO57_1028732 [Entomophthora muscae]|uniref:Uncharacterized protein n=1 Tax=Entomophthora muscae TaxID=34485 RepID=A0ACC2UM31_9FUNG|nr:hypothetical protein DSO57_1028732 [Entomophthora muscae]